MRLIGIFFVTAKSNSNDFIFAHEELGVWECFAEGLEVIGAHVIEGEDVEVFELVKEGVDLVDDELLVLAHLGLYLSQRHYLVLLCERHQQSNIILLRTTEIGSYEQDTPKGLSLKNGMF